MEQYISPWKHLMIVLTVPSISILLLKSAQVTSALYAAVTDVRK